jgi:uncharacterized protein (UPF0548 family)
MAEWRIGRGWSEAELADRLDRLHTVGLNFPEPVDEIGQTPGWDGYSSESVIGQGRPGPPEPEGPFERGRTAIANYEFSDPRIVIAHFDPDVPLEGRRMLLEMRAVRALHYLGGVVVGAVRSETKDGKSTFGFRYDTLEGHIEKGAEWFLLTKDHASGELRFRIAAYWQPGQFPNWWSRLGFTLLGKRYQRIWHNRAHAFMAERVRLPLSASEQARGDRLKHAPPDIVFKRYKAQYE